VCAQWILSLSWTPAWVEARRTDGQRSTLGAPLARGATYCHRYELEFWSWLVHFLNWIFGRWDVHARRRAGGQVDGLRYWYHAILFG